MIYMIKVMLRGFIKINSVRLKIKRIEYKSSKIIIFNLYKFQRMQSDYGSIQKFSLEMKYVLTEDNLLSFKEISLTVSSTNLGLS